MAIFILRRLAGMIPVLFVVSFLSFGIIWLVPGDPAAALVGPSAGPEEIERVREQLGLNASFVEQFLSYYARLFQGDLGESLLLNEPVAEALMDRLPVTLTLTFMAMAMALVVGLPLGIIAATKRGTAVDQGVMAVSLLGLSLPDFWVGLVLIFLFAASLGWLPTGGYVPISESFTGWLAAMALPAITLGTSQIGLVARMCRSSMLEVLSQDYIRTVRAKGAGTWAVLVRHGLRNALIPIITVAGVSFGLLLSGSVVVETVFSLPGVGRLTIGGVMRRDYPIIQGGLLFSAFIFLFVNLIVDILYGLVDPKVRHHGR